MKKTLAFFVAVAAAGAYADGPLVSDIALKAQSAPPHLVTVSYKLSNEPAYVTFDIETNDVSNGTWKSVGGTNLWWSYGGDVDKLVQPTGEGEARKIYWSPDRNMGGLALSGDNVRARVTAWPTNSPPLYLALDLCAYSNATYYASEEMVPGGVTNRMYKERYLLMRRIPAKNVTWCEGLPASYWSTAKAWAQGGLTDAALARRLAHKVKMTHDYYIGVYPVTIWQYACINSTQRPAGDNDSRLPQAGVRYNYLRGDGVGTNWPVVVEGVFDRDASHAVASGSWIQKARNKTGLAYLDLPTEAQFEFAARAGVPGLMYTTDTVNEENFAKLGRVSANKNEADCEGLTGDRATVGSYLPNGFGLYDMVGNVRQWGLDWYESWEDMDTSVVHSDPVGPETGTARVCCGNQYNTSVGWGFVGNRTNSYPPNYGATEVGYIVGVRLAITLY